MSAPIQFEHDRYLRIVAMHATEARRIVGELTGKAPTTPAVYLGQADPKRYKFGSKVYGFRPPRDGKCKCAGCTAP